MPENKDLGVEMKEGEREKEQAKDEGRGKGSGGSQEEGSEG